MCNILHFMHVFLLKIKQYIYLKLNEVLNVFISREGERERLRKIEQKRLSYYTYTGMSPFNLLEKYSFSYLFVYKIDKDKGGKKSRTSFYMRNS